MSFEAKKQKPKQNKLKHDLLLLFFHLEQNLISSSDMDK